MNTTMTNNDSGQGMFLLLILLFVYFIPGIVGFAKGKNSAGAIFLLNLFLGWSFIGWVIALIWAAANDPKKVAPVIYRDAPPDHINCRCSHEQMINVKEDRIKSNKMPSGRETLIEEGMRVIDSELHREIRGE